MWIIYLLLVVILIAGGVYFWRNIKPDLNTRHNLALLGKEAPTLTQAGITFRDLNKNGKLDPYEDPRRPIEERVEDLLKQMTLAEKAGLMFQTMIGMNKDGTILEKIGMFPLPQSSDMIARRLMNHFNILTDVAKADIAILRLSAPYEKRRGLMESFFHAGDLDFKEPEKSRILNILKKVPTVVDIYLERPAVIPEIAEQSAALLANFGANDNAVLDVIFGKFTPQGKLPFELPSSMEAVLKQKEDLPYDSENPLFKFGHGLSY